MSSGTGARAAGPGPLPANVGPLAAYTKHDAGVSYLRSRSMDQEYYQLGGYRPQIQWHQSNTYDDKKLAYAIADASSPLRSLNTEGVVELVLGIKGNGSSHLLLPNDEMRLFAAAHRLPLPNPRSALRPRAFESLSPINFSNKDQLKEKLTALKPKGNSKGKGGDNSQANRVYDGDRLDLYRGAFEHGRVIYSVLNNSIKPRKYGLDDTSWTQKIRICSFVFNVKGLDDRHSAEKTRNPVVLDMGLCEARLPDLTPDYSTAKHIVNAANSLLGRKDPKKTFLHGSTETVPDGALPQHFQAFFKDHQGSRSPRPMILLVSKRVETQNYLQHKGVDMSHWQNGIRDLLMPEGSRTRAYSPPRSRQRLDSRSSSPRRSNENWKQEQGHSRQQTAASSSRYPPSTGDGGSSNPTTRQTYAPVYILDVRELYIKLMHTENVQGAVDIARNFRMSEEVGWCAGNEAPLLVDIWREMISSLPIDEQRVMRDMALSAEANQTPAQPEQPQFLDDSDEEQDPNTIVHKPPPKVVDDHYNMDESDHSDDFDE